MLHVLTSLTRVALVMITLALPQVKLLAQYNGDFQIVNQSCAINSDPNQPTASSHFQTNCITSKWRVSHGTPELCQYPGSSNIFTMMWSGRWFNNSAPSRGEGIFLACEFKKGQMYRVKFKLHTKGTINNVYVYLTNSPTAMTQPSYVVDDGSYNYPQPIDYQSVKAISSYNRSYSTGWEEFIVDFVPNKNFNNFWIYPEDDTYPYDLLYLDDVSINTCIPSKIYSNTSNLPSNTTVSDFIEAGAATSVLNGQSVNFRAQNEIRLKPGFSANNGCNFSATIGDCIEAFICTPFLSRISYEEAPLISSVPDVTVYPNPSQGTLTITFNQEDQIKNLLLFDVVDMNSQNISWKNTKANEIELVVENYKKGIFILQINTATKVLKKKISFE